MPPSSAETLLDCAAFQGRGARSYWEIGTYSKYNTRFRHQRRMGVDRYDTISSCIFDIRVFDQIRRSNLREFIMVQIFRKMTVANVLRRFRFPCKSSAQKFCWIKVERRNVWFICMRERTIFNKIIVWDRAFAHWLRIFFIGECLVFGNCMDDRKVQGFITAINKMYSHFYRRLQGRLHTRCRLCRLKPCLESEVR